MHLDPHLERLFPKSVLDFYTFLFESRLRTVGDQINRNLPVTDNMILAYSAQEIALAVIGSLHTMSRSEKIELMKTLAPKGVTINEGD